MSASRRAAVALAAVASLAGCGNEAEMNNLKSQLSQAQTGAAKVQQDLTKAQQDLAKLQADLAAAKQEAAKAAQDLAAARAAQADGDKARADAAAKLDAAGKSLAQASQERDQARAAADAARQEKDKAAADLAKARQDLDAAKAATTVGTLEKQLSDANARIQALDQQSALKDQAVAKAQADATAAAAKVAALEQQVRQLQAAPAPSADAVKGRLSYAGEEYIEPYHLVPLSFLAKKGETIAWSWSIKEVPATVTVDAIEFLVVGPDQTELMGCQAGWQKKDDKGSITAEADGRYTILWSNRHPAEPFLVEFQAGLTPAGN